MSTTNNRPAEFESAKTCPADANAIETVTFFISPANTVDRGMQESGRCLLVDEKVR
jgi:hypothetical protein